MDYIELNIEFDIVNPWREIAITYLSEQNFESFVESKNGLKAYISQPQFEVENIAFLETLDGVNSHNYQIIKDENWNAKWEENFDPVFVGEKLAILAPFHDQSTNHKLKVLIQPQMSFGTGHHQTTWLAAQQLLNLELKNKSVLDMGTGTGVLAILAEKLGAKTVFAPDIDEWSYNNAKENCKLNDCKNVKVALGSNDLLEGWKFDVLIANINKNILIEQFKSYSDAANEDSKLFISGFFKTDVDDLVAAALNYGFIFEKEYNKDEWALVEFKKK